MLVGVSHWHGCVVESLRELRVRPGPGAWMLTREEDVDAHALRRQGWTISAIARHLGHDHKTIRAPRASQKVSDMAEILAPPCTAALQRPPPEVPDPDHPTR
jgi:hypothetical protein